jgi:redox-sensitive bicupin YhaK (pirin superfamily)
MKKGNGLYFFIISGSVSIDGQKLDQRDGLGLLNTEKVRIVANENAEVLLMDLPMQI